MQRRHFRWYRSLVLVAGIVFLYLFISQTFSMWEIHQETVANRQKLEQVEQVHQDLLTERAELDTPEYIEKVARENLGLVKPGEVPYVPSKK